jgi:Ca2+-dependent lipid-binding protein
VFFKLKGRNLPNEDKRDSSDPFVKIYVNSGSGYECIGRSETIENTHNPDWDEVFSFDYSKDQDYFVWIEVRDLDPVDPDDAMGNGYFFMNDPILNGTVSLSKGGYVILTPESVGSVGGGRC